MYVNRLIVTLINVVASSVVSLMTLLVVSEIVRSCTWFVTGIFAATLIRLGVHLPVGVWRASMRQEERHALASLAVVSRT